MQELTYSKLDLITNEDLKSFVTDFTSKYSTQKKVNESEKLIDVLIDYLKFKNLYNQNVQQLYIEVLFVSSYVYNIFTDKNNDKEDVLNLFKVRQNMLNNKYDNIDKTLLDAIAQTVEAQYGEQSPVPLCKPTTNSPSEIFSVCVWIYNTYLK